MTMEMMVIDRDYAREHNPLSGSIEEVRIACSDIPFFEYRVQPPPEKCPPVLVEGPNGLLPERSICSARELPGGRQ